MRAKQTMKPVKLKRIISWVAILVLFGFVPLGTGTVVPTRKPVPFLLEIAAKNDVVLLGTTHQRPQILDFIAQLIPQLSGAGVTHIGLEIASDQQSGLDRFMKTGLGLSEIEVFPGIDCPEYRHLLEIIKDTSLKPVALDLPRSMWTGGYTRDEWMARRIQKTLNNTIESKILVIVGNLHVLKKVEWSAPEIRDRFIRSYLSELMPGRKLFSVAECVPQSDEACNFRKHFAAASKPFGFETRNINDPLWLTDYIAAKEMPAHQGIDAVIIH